MIKNIFLGSLMVLLLSSSPGFAADYVPDWRHDGRLESLSDDYIVVSDSQYRLSSAVEFYALSGEYVVRYQFKQGVPVVLTLDEAGKEVVAIWLVDKPVP